MAEITIQELQALISQQKLAAQFQYGAFKDGFLAAWDILNVYLNMKLPKCVECRAELSEEEIAEGNGTCELCYQRLMAEHNAETNRNR